MLSHAQISHISPSLKAALKNSALVIGFNLTEPTGGAKAKISYQLTAGERKEIEKHFALALDDELSFFAPTGKAGEIWEIPVSAPGSKTSRIIFLGVGDGSVTHLRSAGAALGRRFRSRDESATIYLGKKRAEIEAALISAALSSYQWSKKTTLSKNRPQLFFATDHSLDNALIIAQSVCEARDLIHTPANIKTPLWMAQQAIARGKKYGFDVKVLAGKDLEPFGGLRAVGNSSPKPGPRFIQATYKAKKSAPHVVIVGKGITFDTGGVSLKRPYDTMMAMKSDMAGASAALSIVAAASQLKLPVNVTALLMCAENALSGTSQRPSDVITQYGGTTVEIINTDAEGRLVLADGLAYADKHLNPDYLVDIATLTGAATLGLGRQYAALFTRDKKVAASLVRAGADSGDRVWHMPLVDDYKDALVSDIADLNHTADKGDYSAGTVTAALFLEHFAGKRRWVHLDIAGTARSESDSGENPKGGTGFGVRLIVEWLQRL